MKKVMKVVNIAAVILWVALIVLVFSRQHTGTTVLKTEGTEGAIDKADYWYDIYAGPKKIGYANTSIDKVGEEIITRHEREIKVSKNGKETVLFDRLKCLSDPSFSIKSFEYTSHFKDEKGLKVTGEVDAGEVLFFLESEEKRRTHKTPTQGREFYLPITFITALVQKKPVPGGAYTVPLLDFSSLSIKDVKISLEEIRPIKVGINISSVYKFRSGNSVWWANERGVIIKEENPFGFTLYKQVEAIAKDLSDRILFDYTSLPYFKANRVLTNAENLKKLEVRVRGYPLDGAFYEKSLVTVRGDTLVIGKGDSGEMKKKSYPLPHRDTALMPYLRADEWVLSDDKNVKGNALNMALVEKNDAFGMARYLNSDLYFSIPPVPSSVLINSADLFKIRFGDFIGRTVMFASFARAVGIPTRLIGGLVYWNGYFYFHTWPEVWFDRWIPVDPTLAQFPADVTHIPLKEGSLKDITSIVRSLESIDIEILEAS
jgi:hypothetical protein